MILKRLLHIGIGILVIWISLGALWIHHQKKNFLRSELKRAHLLAELLAQKNIVALQNQLEPLLSKQEILQEEGVVDAAIFPFSKKSFVPSKSLFRIERPIFGTHQEELGKAILIFKPKAFPFYFYSILVLFPVLCILSLLKASFTKKECKVSPREENYPWLSVLEPLVGKEILVFDLKGNILASIDSDRPKHILDLFQDPAEAQEILKEVEGLVRGEKSRLSLGFWRTAENEKRFLLVR